MGSVPGQAKILSSPTHPHHILCPFSFLFSGIWAERGGGFFSRVSYLLRAPNLRMCGALVREKIYPTLGE